MNKSNIFFAFFIVFSIQLQAQITRNDAINLLKTQILGQDYENYNIFATDQSLSEILYVDDRKSVELPFKQNWVFILHSSTENRDYYGYKYVIIDAQSGDYKTKIYEFFPRNRRNFFTAFSMSQSLKESIESKSERNIDAVFDPNDNSFALIFSNYDNDKAWHEVSLIYNVLIQTYGYKKENIFVHYANGNSSFGNDLDGGTSSNDIDYNSTMESVQNTLNEMAGITDSDPDINQLTRRDQLALFFTNTEGQSSYPKWKFGQTFYNVSDITNILKQIECAHMYTLSTINHGNQVTVKFLGEFKCQNRFTHFSSLYADEKIENYITGGLYGEYLFYWAAAVRKYYPNIDEPWLITHPVGYFPFEDYSGLEDHPGDIDPDDNDDGFIQLKESFRYANKMNSWSNDGYYYNPYISGQTESSNYFNMLDEIDDYDFYTMAGIAGLIQGVQRYPNNPIRGQGIILNKSVNIISSTFEIFYDYENSTPSYITFLDNTEMSVLYTHLAAENYKIGDNVLFTAGSVNTPSILFLLEIDEIGENFTVEGFWDLKISLDEGLVLDGVTFNNNWIRSWVSVNDTLTVKNSIFTENLWRTDGQSDNYKFLNCNLINSTIFSDIWGYSTIEVIDCDFDGNYTDPPYWLLPVDGVLNLQHYKEIKVIGNTFSNGDRPLIVDRCGEGTGSRMIKDNEIFNCTGAAIELYDGKVNLKNNYIHDCEYGIEAHNNCHFDLRGSASDNAEGTQRIMDCDEIEIKIGDVGSIPYYVKYNVIQDDDNSDNTYDPLIWIFEDDGSLEESADFSRNCYGEGAGYSDFIPLGDIIFEPEWCPGDGAIPNKEVENYTIYGSELIEEGNYDEAQGIFQMIVEDYPDTKYADVALKNLFVLEANVYNDLISLMDYIATNPSIQGSERLADFGEKVTTMCNEQLQEWQLAIDYYENILQSNPELQDSIYAIIDLGNLYLQMQNVDGKSPDFVCKMPEHIPASKSEFIIKRTYLLSLLKMDKDQIIEESELIDESVLGQNSPNPTNGELEINLNLDKPTKGSIRIYSINGSLVKEIPFDLLEGKHTINVNLLDAPSGLYYYSLYAKQELIATKKMLIVN
jgi:tetratricopeptide (TPR) repeat protein